MNYLLISLNKCIFKMKINKNNQQIKKENKFKLTVIKKRICTGKTWQNFKRNNLIQIKNKKILNTTKDSITNNKSQLLDNKKINFNIGSNLNNNFLD